MAKKGEKRKKNGQNRIKEKYLKIEEGKKRRETVKKVDKKTERKKKKEKWRRIK